MFQLIQPPSIAKPLLDQFPYLQHLLKGTGDDGQTVYLFPHTFALAAFGIPSTNDYALRKHYDQLQEGIHLFRVPVQGGSKQPRIYYSIAGVQALANLVGTQGAQQFASALMQYIQVLENPPVPGGAIVPVAPAMQPTMPSVSQPYSAAQPHLAYPVAQTTALPILSPQGVMASGYAEPLPQSAGAGGYDLVNQFVHLTGVALQVQAQEFKAEVEQAVQTVSNQGFDTLKEAVQLVTQVQAGEWDKLDRASGVVGGAQQQLAETAGTLTPTETHHHHTYVQHAKHPAWLEWLASQDGVAVIALVFGASILLGFGTYIAVRVMTPPTPVYQSSTQTP